MYGIQPVIASATKRKTERRDTRNALGTSRDDAPSVFQATRAAIHLNRLLYLASGRRFEIRIKDNRQNKIIEPFEANRIADKEFQADRERIAAKNNALKGLKAAV
jgi:hypothetical protein